MKGAPMFDFDAPSDPLEQPDPAPVIGRAPSGVMWQPAYERTPSQGTTPAAAHASATGAELAKRLKSDRTKRLLALFLLEGKLTIAEAATQLNLGVQSVCPLWNRLEHTLGWIHGTGEYYSYHVDRQLVHREWHVLTARGREVAIALRDGSRGPR